MKQIFTYSIVLLALSIGLAGCSSRGHSEDDSVNVYKDIIQEYAALADAQDTARIQPDFLWTDKSLGSGWSLSERTHRWATGTQSTLLFQTEADESYTLHLQCWPPVYTERQQELSLFLNEEFVQTIRISPKEKNYSINLPKTSLVKGNNKLLFKHSQTQKPCDFTESDDCRELALAFEKIEFEPTEAEANVEVDNGIITQAAGASFSYYVKLPKDATLEMYLKRRTKGLIARITLRTDDGLKKEVRIEKEGELPIDLRELAGEIVEISFLAETTEKKNEPESLELEWSEIQLQTPPKKEAETQDAQGRDISLQEALKSYNTIYIVLDAFHAKHASLYGYERQTTPFLDELAEESIVFDKMFANAPYTLASTASLFTSRYSHEHGLVEEINRIHPIIPTLSELLSGADIESGLISDSGWLKESAWGLLRGFSRLYNKQQYSHDAQKVIAALDDFYSTHAEQPGFSYTHLIPPHGPYTPPEKFRVFMEPGPDFISPSSHNLALIDTGELPITPQQLDEIIATYDANILFADHLTRQIFAFLEEQELLERSIVIVSSDHGEAFRQHGRMLHNTTVFDEMLHVPFIVRFPRELKLPARRITVPISLIDVAPTLMDIYGISELPEFSGASLLPLILREEHSAKKLVYAESLYTGVRTLRDARYKYIHSPADGDMLFDMTADPQEQHNLLNTFPVTTGYFRQMIHPYLQESSATQNVELNTLSEETLKNLEDLGYIK